MSKYILDGEYKGFPRLIFLMYIILITFKVIDYLPTLGITGQWISWSSTIEPLVLGIWYIVFMAYIVKNRGGHS